MPKSFRTVLGTIPLIFVLLPGEVRSAENFLVARTPSQYVFIDAASIEVGPPAVRSATVTTVMVGGSAERLGYKSAIQTILFHCSERRAAIKSGATFDVNGMALTQGGGTDFQPVRAGTVSEPAYRFVCLQDRDFSNYFGEDPVVAAARLFSLMHPAPNLTTDRTSAPSDSRR
jgi:hypothetical protein